MRCLYLPYLLLILTATALSAAQKLEVFTLENRDAASLVPVIANAIGPEGRVSVDERTNSLIVAYPAEMQEGLREIIAQLDRQDPNIEVELITLEIETKWFEQLGLSGRSSLSPGEYDSLLPLLVEDERATLHGRQRVVTRNNLPARIGLIAPGKAESDSKIPAAPIIYQLFVTPRLMGENVIEVKLAQSTPSVVGENMGASRAFSTIAIMDGGAQVFNAANEDYSLRRGVQVPLLPIGLEKAKHGAFQRIVFLHAKATDYKEDRSE